MRSFVSFLLLFFACISIRAQHLPATIHSGLQGNFHVQGIAYDHEHDCMYMSFTTSLLKFDMQGHLLASIVGLTGHLGSIGINPDDDNSMVHWNISTMPLAVVLPVVWGYRTITGRDSNWHFN